MSYQLLWALLVPGVVQPSSRNQSAQAEADRVILEREQVSQRTTALRQLNVRLLTLNAEA